MFAALGGLGANLLRQYAPAAINWGLNKLMNSSLGQKVLSP